MLATGLALYASASLAGGLATGAEVQLTARAVQVSRSAVSRALAVNTTFAEGRDRNRALGIWGGAGAAGLVVGVLLGGGTHASIRLGSRVLCERPAGGRGAHPDLLLIEADRPRDVDRVFDLPGALTATGAITLLVFALVQGPNLGWGSPGILVAAAAGLVLLVLFMLIERRSRDPLVPARLLANRVLTMALVIAFMFMATFGSALYFLSIYFQDVRGYDALQAGVGFLLPTGVVVAGSALAGRAVTRFGIKRTLSPRSLSVQSALSRWLSGVARRLLHHADPRPHRSQHRRRGRVHDDVHRRVHGVTDREQVLPRDHSTAPNRRRGRARRLGPGS